MPCNGCRKFTTGVRGATAAILQTDPVDRAVRLSRESECHQCPQRGRMMCRKCGCVIAAKIRVASESCPIGRWTAVTSSGRTSHTEDSAGDSPT